MALEGIGEIKFFTFFFSIDAIEISDTKKKVTKVDERKLRSALSFSSDAARNNQAQRLTEYTLNVERRSIPKA